MELAVAVTCAMPPDPMVALAAGRVAAAPFPAGFTEKLTTPPATGSTGLIGVTITDSGLVDASSVATAWGVLPVTTENVNPWLWNAPMSGVELDGGRPRSSVETPGIVVPV